MKLKTARILFALPFVCMYACTHHSKHNPTPTPIDSPIYVNYTELKPGNYWVYQEFKLDSANGAAIATNIIDSCFVEKDTTVNGHVYHKFMDAAFAAGPGQYTTYLLRDSLGYMVNSTGRILFSSTDYTNPFLAIKYTNPIAGIVDSINIEERMGYKDEVVTVGAGTFTTSAFRRIYHLPAPTYHYGPIREYVHRYAAGVGLVIETAGWYISTPEIWERRLIRYHLEP